MSRNVIKSWFYGTLFLALIVTLRLNLRVYYPQHLESERLLTQKPQRYDGISGVPWTIKEFDSWEDVKILCFTINIPKEVNRTNTIRSTWGKRCSTYISFSNESSTNNSHIIKLFTTQKLVINSHTIFQALRVIGDIYFRVYDWVMFVDLGTYVIVENLQNLLQYKPLNLPLYITHDSMKLPAARSSKIPAGFLLNRMAMEVVTNSSGRLEACGTTSGLAIFNVEQCLEGMKITKDIQRDSNNKTIYNSLALGGTLLGEYSIWPLDTKSKQNLEIVYPVMYFNIKDRQLRSIEYILYQARIWKEHA